MKDLGGFWSSEWWCVTYKPQNLDTTHAAERTLICHKTTWASEGTVITCRGLAPLSSYDPRYTHQCVSGSSTERYVKHTYLMVIM
jgi:hypothetical protein